MPERPFLRAGVESPEVSAAMEKPASAGIRSAVCTLGNSIFADAPMEEVGEILGNAELFSCSSSDAPPRLSRGSQQSE